MATASYVNPATNYLGNSAGGIGGGLGSSANLMTALPQQGIHGMATLAPVQGSTGSLPGAGGGAGGATAGPTAQQTALANALAGQYNTQIGNLQGDLQQLQGAYGVQQNQAGNDYNTQYNSLADQHASGQANLGLQQTQLDQSRANGLRDLNNQMRGMIAGYQNQLGNAGAGSSSANDLIGYALTQEGNRNRGDLLQQAGNQQTGLNEAGKSLESGFNDQVNALSQWKQDQLNNLAIAYAQQAKSYQDQIGNAKGYQAFQTALYNPTAAQGALQQLQALDSQYGDHLANLKAAYNTNYGVDPSYAKGAQAYTAQPVSPGQLQGLSLANNQASYSNPNVQATVVKRPDQQF